MSRYSATIAPLACAIVELRGAADAVARVLAAAGLLPPERPNSAREAGGAATLWLGPRRWLVLGARADEERLEGALAAAAAREPHALAVTVGDMLAGLALCGTGARDVLAQGTPLDLDALAQDGATMTELFMVPALVRSAGDGFDLWVDRSLGAYLDECLRVANGREG